MTDLDNVEQQLVLARRALTPSAAFRDRVRSRLASPRVVPVPAPRGWQSLRATGSLGAAVGATLLAAGFLVGYLAQAPDVVPPPPPQQQTRPAEIALEPIELEPVTSPADTIESDAPNGVATPTHAVTSKPKATLPSVTPQDNIPSEVTPMAQGPREELVLLQRAERAVRANNSALALALTGELEQRYPDSPLAEERDAIELMAYCQVGSTDANARAQAFLRAHSRSVYAERIAKLCPSTPSARGDVEP